MQENNEGGQNKQPGLSWSTPQNQSQPQKPPIVQAKPVVVARQNTSAAKYAGMVVIGVIAGVVLAWGWASWHSSSPIAANNGTAATTTSGNNLGVNTGTVPAMGSDPGFTIMSPQAAGNSVAVGKAIVSVPTWIVIYEDNNGAPGNALGAALFFPEGQAGTVELLRATIPGKTYLAVKQVDNGDRKFSLKDDQFLTEGGQVQWVSFKTN